jgi:biopolymer transport protein ExbB
MKSKRPIVLFASICIVFFAATAPLLYAQETAESAAKAPTLFELFEYGKWINIPNLALSFIALVMFLFLILAMTAGSFAPRRFTDNLSRLIAGRQFDQAIHLCQTNDSVFIAPILQRVLENRDKEHAALIEIVSAEGRRRAEPIWNRINYLSEIGNIAPMLGLLGTVLGMIEVFFTLTTRTAGEKAAQLASGIGLAMGTTLFGLMVAILAAFFYSVLRSRATGVLGEAERVCHALADETARHSIDPKLRRIDTLADAARQKIAAATAARPAIPSSPKPQQT